MKKRLVAALVAVLLAAFGVLALMSYASGANDRAYEGARLVEVLQVTTNVPAKTPVDRLAGSVTLVKVPASVKVKGSLTTLGGVKSMVTNTSLKKGEQVLRSRFGHAGKAVGTSDVPKGFQEISISVASPRLPRGKLEAGDRVGVIASYDVEGSKYETNFVNRQQLLVTKVSKGLVPDGSDSTAIPSLVTLAVKTKDAEQIVNASEFGKVWLTLQNPETDTGGRTLIDPKDVLR